MYSYKKDPKTGEVLPIILDKHNHIFDAVRYGLDGFIQRRGNMGVWEALANSPG
jgi:phage terminase large subunit